MVLLARNVEGRTSVILHCIHVCALLEEELGDVQVAISTRIEKREKALLAPLHIDVHSEAKPLLDLLQIAMATSLRKIFDLLLGEVLLLGLARCLLANRPVGLPVAHLALASAVLGLHAPAARAGLARVGQGRAATCANVASRLAKRRSRSGSPFASSSFSS